MLYSYISLNELRLQLFQIWILEASVQSGRWWTKAPNVCPRAIAWTQKVALEGSDLLGQLFPEVFRIYKIRTYFIAYLSTTC